MKIMKITTLNRMAAHENIVAACEYFDLNYSFMVDDVLCSWHIDGFDSVDPETFLDYIDGGDCTNKYWFINYEVIDI